LKSLSTSRSDVRRIWPVRSETAKVPSPGQAVPLRSVIWKSWSIIDARLAGCVVGPFALACAASAGLAEDAAVDVEHAAHADALDPLAAILGQRARAGRRRSGRCAPRSSNPARSAKAAAAVCDRQARWSASR
jgi:hypothetical protein